MHGKNQGTDEGVILMDTPFKICIMAILFAILIAVYPTAKRLEEIRDVLVVLTVNTCVKNESFYGAECNEIIEKLHCEK